MGGRNLGQGIRIEGLQAWYGREEVLRGVELYVPHNSITAIIGPSGCGKSTLIRCINRLHETVTGARVSGGVWLGEGNIYDPGVDPVQVRRRVGMVFQKPCLLPASIFENVAVGLRLNGLAAGVSLEGVVERCLRRAALWEEVKDRLRQPANALSGGQQQRLCIARALAVEPEALLLDEPCSALDPAATLKIEELLMELAKTYTLVIVTHNMQQAARVAARTVFMLLGELVEEGETVAMFTRPSDKRTEDYITGRFG